LASAEFFPTTNIRATRRVPVGSLCFAKTLADFEMNDLAAVLRQNLSLAKIIAVTMLQQRS
jgi:hypothetical protein